jgi:ParB-like nuclease domain
MTLITEFHPIADLFPLMEGAEFDELVSDIKANGLIEPVVMLDGMILDGRNRYRACIEAGTETTYRPFTGDDPLGYVISLNLRRRHLDESQRAMVAGKLANLRDGQRKSAPPIGEGAVSQSDAAALLNRQA